MKKAFIRKNTQALRDKFEAMGYSHVENGHGEWHIPICELPHLHTGIYKGFYYYMGTNGYWYDSWVDCGEDEEMFLKIVQEAINESKV